MKVIRAEHLGMCFGVRDAMALAIDESQRRPITVLGDLVHNSAVLAELRRQGVNIEHQLANVSTPVVMITAHGTSEKAKSQIRERGHELMEATCPLVHFAHESLRQLVSEGFFPVIIGKREHVEVRGMTDDLAAYEVILTEEDVLALPEHDRIGIVSQTTQPIDKVRHLVQRVRARFPKSEVRFKDTVCQPTKQRQSAAAALAQRSDVVIVIGGHHSNNTRELVETCLRHCSRVHQVENVDELDENWLQGAETVGITAGTSTPDSSIDAVENTIRSMKIASDLVPSR